MSSHQEFTSKICLIWSATTAIKFGALQDILDVETVSRDFVILWIAWDYWPHFASVWPCICVCIHICICICNRIWERETRGPPLPPPCDRGPNPISPIITTVHHDSARRLNPYGRILPMMQSAQDQRVLHNDQKPSRKLQEYILMSRGGIFHWPMAFQLLAKFLLAIVNSIGKMQMHHTEQVATSVYIMSVSVIRE